MCCCLQQILLTRHCFRSKRFDFTDRLSCAMNAGYPAADNALDYPLHILDICYMANHDLFCRHIEILRRQLLQRMCSVSTCTRRCPHAATYGTSRNSSALSWRSAGCCPTSCSSVAGFLPKSVLPGTVGKLFRQTSSLPMINSRALSCVSCHDLDLFSYVLHHCKTLLLMRDHSSQKIKSTTQSLSCAYLPCLHAIGSFRTGITSCFCAQRFLL